MSEREPSYYAIIPASVRYDKSLSANAKLLYGELTALANKKGYCWASNEYFAELYDVHRKTVSQWISELRDKGYIRVVIEDDPTQGKARKIYIAEPAVVSLESQDGEGIRENADTPSPEKDGEGVREIMDTYPRKDGEGCRENTAYNITVNNTGNNTTTTTTTPEAEKSCGGGSDRVCDDPNKMKRIDELPYFLRNQWGAMKGKIGPAQMQSLMKLAAEIGLKEMSECIVITAKAPEDRISLRYLEGTIAKRKAERAIQESKPKDLGRIQWKCDNCGIEAPVEISLLLSNRGKAMTCPECNCRHNVDQLIPKEYQ